MNRGTRADFWRSVDLGHRMAQYGWIPWHFELQRPIPLNVGGRRYPGLLFTSAAPFGCFTGAMMWVPKGVRRPYAQFSSALKQAANGGPFVEGEENRAIYLRRGILTVSDIDTPNPGVRIRERIKLAPPRRAHLIRALIDWLRSKGRSMWSSPTLMYRHSWSFRSAGISWSLFSDLFFARREGLYWNNWLTSKLTVRTFHRLQRDGFYERATEGLHGLGFWVAQPSRYGVLFDQDFLSSSVLENKARQLIRWRPANP